MEIIDYELKRYSQLKNELETRTTASPPPISRLPLPRSGRRPQTGISSRIRTATPSPSPTPLSGISDSEKKRPSSIPSMFLNIFLLNLFFLYCVLLKIVV